VAKVSLSLSLSFSLRELFLGRGLRFVAGLQLRPTNPKAAAVQRRAEVVLVLQGHFEVSEAEARGAAPFRADQFLASDLSHPRHLYRRATPPSECLPSPRPNRAPDLYPLTADLRNPRTVGTLHVPYIPATYPPLLPVVHETTEMQEESARSHRRVSRLAVAVVVGPACRFDLRWTARRRSRPRRDGPSASTGPCPPTCPPARPCSGPRRGRLGACGCGGFDQSPCTTSARSSGPTWRAVEGPEGSGAEGPGRTETRRLLVCSHPV
jgi:hypothetical protein